MKANKYDYLYVLQGMYSQGWEGLTAAPQTVPGRRGLRDDMRAYRVNEGGEYRVIRRRVKKNTDSKKNLDGIR